MRRWIMSVLCIWAVVMVGIWAWPTLSESATVPKDETNWQAAETPEETGYAFRQLDVTEQQVYLKM